MTTLTFKLSLSEQLAEAYKQTLPSDKVKIKQLVNQLLEKTLLQNDARRNMYAVLAELHAEAKNNGLTDELLDELTAN
jgi:hypothetical protein